jgi:hypothetical protein
VRRATRHYYLHSTCLCFRCFIANLNVNIEPSPLLAAYQNSTSDEARIKARGAKAQVDPPQDHLAGASRNENLN